MRTFNIHSIFVVLAAVTGCLCVRSHVPPLPQTTPSTTTTAAPTQLVSAAFPQWDLPSEPHSACPEASNNSTPLGKLRIALRNPGYSHSTTYFDAYLVFYSDEHLSDEPSAEERRLEYLSGWAWQGLGVVLAEGGAALWVAAEDVSRARATVSCAWMVFNRDDESELQPQIWINERVGRRAVVGGDAKLASQEEWASFLMEPALLELMNAGGLVDRIWNAETDPLKRRPEASKIVAKLHNPEYIGMSWLEKVALVRAELRSKGADAMVVTAPDEVCWLLNVRGRDLPHAPLWRAFVYLSMREVRVYARSGQVTLPVRDALAVYNCYTPNCTQVFPHSEIYADLRLVPESNILLPHRGPSFQRGANQAFLLAVPATKLLSSANSHESPIIQLKAQKSVAEARGMRRAHLRDAVAMCTVLRYMEQLSLRNVSEETLARLVDHGRSTQAGFVGLSMATKVAFGANGADPFYKFSNNRSTKVFNNSTLIIQSGGQYDEGTTVVTRTIHFGSRISDAQKRAYTAVLRSFAALGTLHLPAAMPAGHIDPIVRAPLWAHDQDYPHPTGHGVGAALNRKEDPTVIDYRQDQNLFTLKERYFIAAEPAWYETGSFGVRLGNVLEVTGTSGGGTLAFRETTLVPFEPKLIDHSLLTDYEIKWLNVYNERIRKTVGPELQSQGLMDAYWWMMNKTVPVALPSKMWQSINAAPEPSKAMKLTALALGVCLAFV